MVAANELLAIGHGHKRACGVWCRRARRSTGAVERRGADAWSAKLVVFTALARWLGFVVAAAHRGADWDGRRPLRDGRSDNDQREREDGAEHDRGCGWSVASLRVLLSDCLQPRTGNVVRLLRNFTCMHE
jgi:hypothetical protein